MSEFVAVKPILVVGGAVGDVVLTLPKLPASGEDIEAQPQERQIGGCAFNVARALRRLDVPVINGMPVGNGDWGTAIEAAMQELDLPVLLRHGQLDNGWCLALVEPNGERTFVTVTGCEAHWNKAQLTTLPLTPETVVYANGYELVGEPGEALRDWLTRLPFDQWRLLDPGPRVGQLGEEFFAMLSDSHTLLTLNRDEVAILCGEGDAVSAAQRYATAHNITLICRLDRDGAWVCDGRNEPQHVPVYPVDVVDTIGAGDAHCAGVLAGLSAGLPLVQAVDLANRVAACVVASRGAAGAPDWQQLQQRFPI
ncbi:PfkB family carbohydrate kinase [Serratia fonticola]|jgi:sugar/nucleoside kinase (ribokinase family)|uniref:PfkB family carbohydrate kinase n=1 Tax=Serratia fonticola TaxID=47917 RepID=UPI002178F092|nr:PfkB family carbohydrate kinase [Serratia fonticola]CAI0858081.1 Ribokinase [Serratia fonticola]CAI0930309.1 Ribokinase [Serratia fonticola]CAI1676835.1 Ribokinase [Serratia fonticola]CAI1925697.1 Ribokinase [Serratia fonticola]